MKKYILFLLLIISFFKTNAQTNYCFRHVNIKDGLSNNKITALCRDSYGFVWIATANGLNRYDGNDFKIYRNNPNDSLSLKQNLITSIQEDYFGNLWLKFPYLGYCVYNKSKDNFIFPAKKYLSDLSMDANPDLVYIDEAKNFWMVSSGKLKVLKPQSSDWFTASRVGTGTITDICANDSLVFVAYSSCMIDLLDINNLKVKKTINLNDYFSFGQNNNLRIFVDHKSNYWCFQRENPNCIYFYDFGKNNWQEISSTKGDFKLSSNLVSDIIEDYGNVWVSMDHGGIDIINLDTKVVTNINPDNNNPYSISEDCIMHLYRDYQGIIWVGTYKSGVDFFSNSFYKFKHIKIPDSYNFDNDINGFEEDYQGNIWLASNNSGVIKLDKNLKNVLYKYGNDVVVDLKCDKKNRIWVGTFQKGVYMIENNKITNFAVDYYQSGKGLTNSNVWSIEEDDNGNIWFGTLGGGINIYDPIDKKFSYLDSKNTNLTSDFISTISNVGDNKMLIGTNNGLFFYNTLNSQVVNLCQQYKFVSSDIICTKVDSRSLVWVGTPLGLNIIDQKNNQIYTLTSQNGLSDDIITSIQEDYNKNMWVSSSNGLMHIIVGMDPQSNNLTFMTNKYSENDGLQSGEFNQRSGLKLSNGNLLFGGLNGVNLVDINQIKYNTFKPELCFTRLIVNNKEAIIDSLYLDRNIVIVDTISLEYNQNNFELYFSAMNYAQPLKTEYKYILKGFDMDYKKISGINAKANYTNLNPGEYTFEVWASNNDGFWSQTPKSLKIIINPPFYKSFWAFCIYTLVIFGILFTIGYLVWRNMHSKILVEQERLANQNNHKLDQDKLNFFTNVSHEFRTQISLILVPLEKLMKNISGNDNKKTLTLINNNALKLLRIVDLILDIRKLDEHGYKLNAESDDIVEFIKQKCIDFSLMYQNKNINFTFSSVSEHITINFDKDKVSKIIINLLSNAYKYTPNGNNIDTKIEILNQNDNTMLKVSIIDTGVGMSQENINHLFDRFFQEKNSMQEGGGVGIGLYLCKEFVEMHGGKIIGSLNPDKGMTFSFTIPMNLKQSVEIKNPIPIENLEITQEHVEFVNLDGMLSEDEQIFMNSQIDKKTILLVDDNDDFRTFMGDSLETNFKVLKAQNGRIALEIMEKEMPDIIVSDVMMPEMDGYTLCKKIKENLNYSHIPVILLTAKSEDENVVKGLESGADDYISKPFNFDVLILRINNLIERRTKAQVQLMNQKEVKPSDIKISSLDEQLLKKAIEIVEENISNIDFSVEMLSELMGMSRVHLYKKLSSITGKSPIEFIRVLRLKRANQMLLQSQLSVAEIAYKVGFNNPKYFSKYFKEEFGMLPSQVSQKK